MILKGSVHTLQETFFVSIRLFIVIIVWNADTRCVKRSILCVFTQQLRNAAVSLLMFVSVRLSVRAHGTVRLPPEKLTWKFIFGRFYWHLLTHFDFG